MDRWTAGGYNRSHSNRYTIPLHVFKGMDMTEHEWRAIWVDTLVKAGSDWESAVDALDLVYGDEPIDTTLNPIQAARDLIDESK